MVTSVQCLQERIIVNYQSKIRENKYKKYRRNFYKCKYKDMRKFLAKLDWNNMLRNKTVTECWNILKCEIGGGLHIEDKLLDSR